MTLYIIKNKYKNNLIEFKINLKKINTDKIKNHYRNRNLNSN